ncbi:MAG: hypothetical protein IT318_04890 [Anaerolineales bacterium]|nr:hypothetical protein [Anaerolineales bacterium]
MIAQLGATGAYAHLPVGSVWFPPAAFGAVVVLTLASYAITARQFGTVTLVAGAREVYLDATGLYLAGAPAGLTGVDAISLSMANRVAARPS